jgi:hypothetical protein
MSGLLQDLTVSVIALGAAATIVRRAVAMFAAKAKPGCSTCASGCASASSKPTPGGENRRIIRPLVIHANRTDSPRPAGGNRVH